MQMKAARTAIGAVMGEASVMVAQEVRDAETQSRHPNAKSSSILPSPAKNNASDKPVDYIEAGTERTMGDASTRKDEAEDGRPTKSGASPTKITAALTGGTCSLSGPRPADCSHDFTGVGEQNSCERSKGDAAIRKDVAPKCTGLAGTVQPSPTHYTISSTERPGPLGSTVYDVTLTPCSKGECASALDMGKPSSPTQSTASTIAGGRPITSNTARFDPDVLYTNTGAIMGEPVDAQERRVEGSTPSSPANYHTTGTDVDISDIDWRKKMDDKQYTREELVEVMARALMHSQYVLGSYTRAASAALSALEAIGAVKVRI